MRFDPSHIKTQIHALLALYPELAEDEMLRADTIEGETDLHLFLRNLELRRMESDATIDTLDKMLTTFKDRRERFVRRQEGLRKLMFDLLQAANLKRVELPEATLSIRNGVPRVVIIDEKSLPKEFLRVRTEPDKTLIKQALSNGESVEGAALSNAEPTLAVRIK